MEPNQLDSNFSPNFGKISIRSGLSLVIRIEDHTKSSGYVQDQDAYKDFPQASLHW